MFQLIFIELYFVIFQQTIYFWFIFLDYHIIKNYLVKSGIIINFYMFQFEILMALILGSAYKSSLKLYDLQNSPVLLSPSSAQMFWIIRDEMNHMKCNKDTELESWIVLIIFSPVGYRKFTNVYDDDSCNVMGNYDKSVV